MDTLMFTPAGVLDLLSKIDELKDLDLSITETLDGKSLQIQVGDSVYDVEMQHEINIPADDQILMELDDANVEAYENLEDSEIVDLVEPVESGLLKEIAKTLMIGGMVRFLGKEMKK